MISAGTVPDVEELQNIEAIKRLKAYYCHYADSGRHSEEFANLFTENAVLDEGEDGVFKGRPAIAKMYQDLWPYLRLNQHLVVNPIIHVEGDKATGQWRLIQYMTTIHPERDRAYFAVGEYREEYVKDGGVWRFQHVNAKVHFCCDASADWATEPFAELLPPEALAALGLSIKN
jgi:hypothetical protein